jgi:AcrR family transcriptional regulator
MQNDYHHGNLKNALIQAGLAILAQEGVHGLSLRKAAKRVGVSHAAPYAHFADKQALIAAIAARGYQDLYILIYATAQKHQNDPQSLIVETAWAYLQYAIQNTHQFKITFSGVVEKASDYPEFREISMNSFDLVVDGVRACQRAGILQPGDPEMLATSLWAGVHGFTLLLLENQIPSYLLARYSLRQLLLAHLAQLLPGLAHHLV